MRLSYERVKYIDYTMADRGGGEASAARPVQQTGLVLSFFARFLRKVSSLEVGATRTGSAPPTGNPGSATAIVR